MLFSSDHVAHQCNQLLTLIVGWQIKCECWTICSGWCLLQLCFQICWHFLGVFR